MWHFKKGKRSFFAAFKFFDFECSKLHFIWAKANYERNFLFGCRFDLGADFSLAYIDRDIKTSLAQFFSGFIHKISRYIRQSAEVKINWGAVFRQEISHFQEIS